MGICNISRFSTWALFVHSHIVSHGFSYLFKNLTMEQVDIAIHCGNHGNRALSHNKAKFPLSKFISSRTDKNSDKNVLI